eukprot:CAMPEP_0119561608 /NCGR_PEP_ID=MMETSP1352-20130426/18128_1 /TAXON_ID=265584 /ORGANISM="Stauroneis constricta, Strain CCMP1120" /LENGTH=601 /DNA_ID=CAMNT_0007609851 /DNA_START=210 /DNA_END=2015 /DNA_ORIENTATION=+
MPVLVLVMLTFFLAACIQAFISTRNTYPDDRYDNWILLGGLTSTSATFRIRSNDLTKNDDARLVIATDEDFQNRVWTSSSLQSLRRDDMSGLVISTTATGLETNSQYYYATVVDGDGSADANDATIIQRGRFRTAPTEGQRANFKFATAGCAWSGSVHPIFSTIREENDDLLFFLHLGDIHYEDLNVDDVERRIHALDRVMASEKQRSLLSLPLAYMYDDHDWLGNDSKGDGVGREAALQSYQEAFPFHEPLPSESANYHAFTVGAVRFVITDLRAEVTDDAMMSAEQQAWLFNEFDQASNFDFVIWVSTKIWIANDANDDKDDKWGEFPKQREEISNYIQDVVPNNLLMIAADAHMLAFDDGSNTYYGNVSATEPDETSTVKKSFPVLQSGPLDRLASFKGGPFSDGCTAYLYERNHQYSTIEFLEEDGKACLEIVASRIDSPSGELEEVFVKRLCGDDIFSESNPGTGSCKTRYFSNANGTLLACGGGLLVIAFILTTQVGLSCCWSIALSVAILILYGVTLIAGFTVPITQGVKQYHAFEAGLIGVLQIATVVIYLFVWACCRRKTEQQAAENDNDDNDDVGGRNDHNDGNMAAAQAY